MKNVLFITHTSDPNTSKGVRHQQIIRYLGENCRLTVIRHDEFIARTSSVSGSQTLFSRLKKFIYRQFIRPYSFPDEFIFIRNWYTRKTIEALKSGPFDTVILGVLPYSFYRIARAIKKNFPGINLIIDISDPFYGNVTVLHSGNFFLKTLARAYESKYLMFADHLVVLNEEIKSFFERTYRLNNVVVIEQGIDNGLAAEIKDLPSAAIGQGKIDNEALNLVYGGMFYKKLREPFELYKAVETSQIPVRLKLFGKINRKFLPVSTGKIDFHGRVSQEELFREYLKADIIVFIDNAYGIQVPGKTAEIMLFNKPVLFISSNEQSASLRYFKNYPKLTRVENSAGQIREGIRSAMTNKTDEHTPAPDLSAFYWQNLVPKFLNLIEIGSISRPLG